MSFQSAANRGDIPSLKQKWMSGKRRGERNNTDLSGAARETARDVWFVTGLTNCLLFLNTISLESKLWRRLEQR